MFTLDKQGGASFSCLYLLARARHVGCGLVRNVKVVHILRFRHDMEMVWFIASLQWRIRINIWSGLSYFEKQTSSGSLQCLGLPDKPNPYITAKSKSQIGQNLNWFNWQCMFNGHVFVLRCVAKGDVKIALESLKVKNYS